MQSRHDRSRRTKPVSPPAPRACPVRPGRPGGHSSRARPRAGVLAWTPVFRARPARRPPARRRPASASIPVYQQAYQNWAGMIVIDSVWTCAPASAGDVVTLANWARASGYRLRAKGMSHNWSPIVLPAGSTGAGYLLVDTTQQLTSVSVASGAPATVTAGAGVTMDTLTAALAAAGYGLCAMPAPGDITLGGLLAINAHGSAIPGTGETPLAGQSYGSLSNLIVSLTAVVWSSAQGQYTLRTFQRVRPGHPRVPGSPRPGVRHQRHPAGRGEPEPALPELGRCQRRGPVRPARHRRVQFLRQLRGRRGPDRGHLVPVHRHALAEGLVAGAQQAPAVGEGHQPVQLRFTNSVTTAENTFFGEVAAGDMSGTPAFEGIAMSLVDTGLVFDGVWDIWGQSQNVLLYVKPTTVRIVEAGFAVITSRASIQQVVSDFYTQYTSRLAHYQGLGQYPMNGPVEIRVTGLDHPADVRGERRAVADPVLGPAAAGPPRVGHRGLADMGTLPVTPGFSQFYTDMEAWIWSHYSGSYATVRPEWSKAWACTSAAPWTSSSILRQHGPGRGQRGPGQRRRLGGRGVDPDLLRPGLGVQQPVPGHPDGLRQARPPGMLSGAAAGRRVRAGCSRRWPRRAGSPRRPGWTARRRR